MASTRIAALTGSPPNGAGRSSGATAAPVTTHELPTASEDPADTDSCRASRDHKHEVFLLARTGGEPIGVGCHTVTAHDPHDFANALSAKLAARSRHVCVLLGAGVGKACGLPDVASLQDDIVRDLSPEEKPLLETQFASGNIEQALSRQPPRPSRRTRLSCVSRMSVICQRRASYRPVLRQLSVGETA